MRCFIGFYRCKLSGTELSKVIRKLSESYRLRAYLADKSVKIVRLLRFQATSSQEVDEVRKLMKPMPTWLLAYHRLSDYHRLNRGLNHRLNRGYKKKIFI